ncbi:helix-turn-helix domain-containing protein [uncultured Sneathiella sp.]|jgi:transcriptional regulator with XRE-family HTH domain|uniref:helix-turn-helix domain-containing protein n=1 Tax=uncultured Sneathiella sp. TaxID=879315 RepID=UPI0030EB6B4C|tara:strand:- start:16 stop:270 length:255 start_codon:yes stop_codon:yes gene_type:complete
MDIFEIGTEIRKQRQQQGMRQVDLAAKARISRSILVALETGKLPELGFGKICALLAALGHTLTIAPAKSRRPTLEDLRNDQNLE